jgi:hypothetical protein
MERGVAVGQREGKAAVEEPGERRHRVGDAGGGERSQMTCVLCLETSERGVMPPP